MKKSIIMVVDDDESILHLSRLVLEKEGYHVLTALSAEEARGLMKELLPELVITDLVMEPTEDGFEFIEKLRASHPNLPVFVLSSLDHRRCLEHAAALGVREYVVKPFRHVDLLKKVRDALA